MAKIVIEDLPENIKISKEEMRKMLGGFLTQSFSSFNVTRTITRLPITRQTTSPNLAVDPSTASSIGWSW